MDFVGGSFVTRPLDFIYQTVSPAGFSWTGAVTVLAGGGAMPWTDSASSATTPAMNVMKADFSTAPVVTKVEYLMNTTFNQHNVAIVVPKEK